MPNAEVNETYQHGKFIDLDYKITNEAFNLRFKTCNVKNLFFVAGMREIKTARFKQ
jgi:hypothetical protein